jgi:hypothetical protein
MMAQVAGLRERIVTLAALHRDVSEGSTVPQPRPDVPPGSAERPAARWTSPTSASCLLPGAGSLYDFWRTSMAGFDAVTKMPRERWDAEKGSAAPVTGVCAG